MASTVTVETKKSGLTVDRELGDKKEECYFVTASCEGTMRRNVIVK